MIIYHLCIVILLVPSRDALLPSTSTTTKQEKATLVKKTCYLVEMEIGKAAATKQARV